MTDARFSDAGPIRPLRLKAESAEDLMVISTLVQDAVGTAGDVAWMPRKHRLVVLVNRFRWENGLEGAGPSTHPYERVRSALTIESALGVRARGLDPADKGRVYELLALTFAPGEGCAGTLSLALAGGAELAVEVECLDVALADLSQPWAAKAGKAPKHAG